MTGVPAVPEDAGRPADPGQVQDYDRIAEAYEALNETSLAND
jgi:hypothetical protein